MIYKFNLKHGVSPYFIQTIWLNQKTIKLSHFKIENQLSKMVKIAGGTKITFKLKTKKNKLCI
jgi:hypothetical protein